MQVKTIVDASNYISLSDAAGSTINIDKEFAKLYYDIPGGKCYLIDLSPSAKFGNIFAVIPTNFTLDRLVITSPVYANNAALNTGVLAILNNRPGSGTGLATEATLSAFKTANHTDLLAVISSAHSDALDLYSRLYNIDVNTNPLNTTLQTINTNLGIINGNLQTLTSYNTDTGGSTAYWLMYICNNRLLDGGKGLAQIAGEINSAITDRPIVSNLLRVAFSGVSKAALITAIAAYEASNPTYVVMFQTMEPTYAAGVVGNWEAIITYSI